MDRYSTTSGFIDEVNILTSDASSNEFVELLLFFEDLSRSDHWVQALARNSDETADPALKLGLWFRSLGL
jgi:hypothetical protein